ncbi:uncharacterized protein N7482_001357 [Penicillium canariense]|uniref:Ubiquitin-protein ligase E3A N-terminal zinc-binding domain-containing protein n=1 Tax=Penicillium canariense TaxID=189055 RepID=A0A9W9IGG9_9EURO|nr:uncharacterized protein N7482_001357 [Penicillium canariense]KAJ5175480.1 hypothetical protein N7482_001357 [Penicillium canariense]
MAENTLTWSAQLAVASPQRAARLPGDKITLPQSALEQLLAAAPLQAVPVPPNNPRVHTPAFDPFNPHTFAAESRARQQIEERQQQLPHPLTFRIVNPQNNRFVYAGIREFSAAENEVALSAILRESLGILDNGFEFEAAAQAPSNPNVNGGTPDMRMGGDVGGEGAQAPQGRAGPVVTVHAKQLPKGTYVRLRPLEAGYDPEDWKALLERHLRDNFTTLTTGEILTVPGTRNESFRFLLDKVFPEGDGICIVDTDLEVDIVALSEEQARETLQKRLERAARAPGTTSGSSVGGVLALREDVAAQVLPGEYVDYELREWKREDVLQIELTTDDPNVFLFASPLGARQRGRPRTDMHVWGDFSTQSSKIFKIRPTNTALEGAEAIYISAYANPTNSGVGDSTPPPQQQQPIKYNLRITTDGLDTAEETEDTEGSHAPGDVQCKNCQQWVPERTLVLHENFCLRNNIFCPQCGNVFQKRSPEWENHWHCPYDSSHGSDGASKHSHDSIFHNPYDCPDCDAHLEGLPALAQHRTTECPGKLILCQFCHLLVPQKGDSDPDLHDPEVMLSGLTPHELVDGGRTTECHLCGKIIRLRDMNTHLRHHDLERVSRPAPRICLNQNCGRTLTSAGNKSLGLCNICFGPLYVDTYDPEGKALRRRIERRYLSQLMTGCGKTWCQNAYCKTGKQKTAAGVVAATSVADITKLTRPLVEPVNVNPDVANTAPFFFCTDETGQHRRNLAEMIAAEGVAGDGKAYDLAWCVAGAEAAGGIWRRRGNG